VRIYCHFAAFPVSKSVIALKLSDQSFLLPSEANCFVWLVNKTKTSFHFAEYFASKCLASGEIPNSLLSYRTWQNSPLNQYMSCEPDVTCSTIALYIFHIAEIFCSSIVLLWKVEHFICSEKTLEIMYYPSSFSLKGLFLLWYSTTSIFLWTDLAQVCRSPHL
jgi:hypothetical protein